MRDEKKSGEIVVKETKIGSDDLESDDALHKCILMATTGCPVDGETIAGLFFRWAGSTQYSPKEVEQAAEKKLHNVLPELSWQFAELFAQFNQKYFSGRLPNYTVEIGYIAGIVIDPWTGVRTAHQLQGAISFDNKILRMRLEIWPLRNWREVMISRLLCEMARIGTKDHEYNHLWIAEMVRLAAEGAPVFVGKDIDVGHWPGSEEVMRQPNQA